MRRATAIVLLACLLLLGQTLKDTSPRTLASLTFTELTARSDPNGTVAFCRDCSAASPLTAGGTGTVVERDNGAWVAKQPAGATLTIASGASALGTSAIASGACATVVTTPASGVASTDSIDWSPNASIKAITGYVPSSSGGLSIAPYPTVGNVNWDVCNWTSASITPGAVTLNWRVVR